MSLQLNAPNEGNRFKEFYGNHNSEIPKLLVAQRVPLSFAGVMRRRLEVTAQDFKYHAVSGAWANNYFGTGDGAARSHDGSAKFVPDAAYLRGLNRATILAYGAVPFSDEEFCKLEGKLFNADVVERLFNRPLTRGEVEAPHPGWLAVARDDKTLLRDYVTLVFAGKPDSYRAMGFYVADPPFRGAEGRLWSVDRLYDYIDYSRAYGYFHLDYGLGRLVGEAPEAPRAATLERRV